MASKYHFAPENENEDDEKDEKEEKQQSTTNTDHAGAQENYGQFLEFGNVIDSLVTYFVENVDLKQVFQGQQSQQEGDDETTVVSKQRDDLLTMVAEICNDLVDDPKAAMFVSIPYVAAALDFERFEDLILDTYEMHHHEHVVDEEEKQDTKN